MPTVTLLTKVYNDFQLRLMAKDLQATFKGLDFNIKNIVASPRGWVRIEFSSQDETVVLNYLATKFGLCPIDIKNINKFATINGRISDFGKSRTELKVDVGVASPLTIDASIQLSTLQVQLVDGRKAALQMIGELFGLRDNMPLNIKILNTDREKSSMQAMFSETQLQRYRSWTNALLDKLIVLGATEAEVRSAIRAAELTRDIVDIEALAPFDQVITCKLGTDAKGLVPKIGRRLRQATLSVFNPRRISEFLDHEGAVLAE